ncbi:hypothetical protein OG455_40260 [Kitasatospora sp. NBC_01287]|uniref:hypothetical protein n=1 Tax=Kitasatospora sp. NBC_01287 TaxID=2903573 RepID=UPI0022524DC0|nr:hypothetical protein [Kitasatospora sp. NBC_01287]MCX4751671.1 hypothetical protein [Kitasatospora sp. NBC_01287]
MRIRPSSLTARALAAVGLAALGTASLAGAGPASAATGNAHHGVKPIHQGVHPLASSNTLKVGSSATQGVVSPTPKVYLVFWGSQWSSDPAGVAPDLQNLFKGLYGSQDTWGTILSQYCEGVAKGTSNCGTKGTHVVHPTSTPLAGTWFDNTAATPANATAAQLAAEAVKAAGHFGNTTQSPNLNAQYVIVSPTGAHPDGFPSSGFCAWHDYTTSSYGNLAYTNLPYVPDTGVDGCTTLTDGRALSGIESTETHEYAETVTDTWPSIGWNGGGGEIGDECENLDAFVPLSTGSFDLQGLWSNSAAKCVTHG